MGTSDCGLTDDSSRSPAVPLQGLHIWVFEAWWVKPFPLGGKELFPNTEALLNEALGAMEPVSVVLYPTWAKPSQLLWRPWCGPQGAGWRRPRAVLERSGKTKLSWLEGIKPGSWGRIFLTGWLFPLIGSTCSIMPFAGEELARWQKCDVPGVSGVKNLSAARACRAWTQPFSPCAGSWLQACSAGEGAVPGSLPSVSCLCSQH